MTDIVVAGAAQTDAPARPLARAARNLIETTAVYLGVALISGASYALTVAVLHSGRVVHLWLASLGPIAIFLIARSLSLVRRRSSVEETQLDLFDPR